MAKTKTKFTPWPWHIEKTDSIIEIRDDNGKVICGFDCEEDKELAYYNACLMLAAPLMFKVLDGFVNSFEKIDRDKKPYEVDQNGIKTIKLLLKNARGMGLEKTEARK